MMKNEGHLEALGKVARVAAPPFLLTRIRARISRVEEAPASWKWAGAIAIGLLLLLNVATISTGAASRGSSVEAVVTAFDLQPSNQLYHE